MRAVWWLPVVLACQEPEPEPIAVACGNGVVEADEQCDEGAANATNGATCSQACRTLEVALVTASFPIDPTDSLVLPPVSLHVGELSGDGLPDLAVVVQSIEGQTAIMHALGDGAGGLSTAWIESASGSGVGLSLGDIDGDGITDVVRPHDYGDELVSNVGAATGPLPGASSSLVDPGRDHGVRPLRTVLDDLDGDGVLDVIALTAGPELTLARGDGAGGFEPKVYLPVPNLANAFDVAMLRGDVTGDGRAEPILVDVANGWATVFPRTRTTAADLEVFGPGVPLALEGSTLGLPGLFDADVDGEMEIVFQAETGQLSVLDWTGSALDPTAKVELIDQHDTKCALPFEALLEPVSVDIDGDGVDELLLACGDEVAVLRHGARAGDFSLQTLKREVTEAGRVGLGAADLDDDGHVDLVGLTRDGELDVWWGDGASVPEEVPATVVLEPMFLFHSWSSLELGDVTGDGRLDLVLASSAGLSVVRGGPGRGLLDPGRRALEEGRAATTVVDVDGDGVDDIVSVVDLDPGGPGPREVDDALLTIDLGGSGATEILEQFGGGELDGAVVSTRPSGLTGGDLDGDGRDDLVVVSAEEARYHVWAATGAGKLELRSSVPMPSGGIRDAALIDADADGHLDLVSVDEAAGQVVVHPGQGDATFGFPVSVASPGASAVAAADVNADGRPDLVVVHASPAQVVVHLSTGPLAWDDGTPLGSLDAGASTAVAVGDVNGDGHADAVVSTSDNRVWVHLGFGTGAFTSPVATLVGSEPRDVVVLDLDGDGIDEIVTGNHGSADLTVLTRVQR